ncbi:MAG TPA: plastocyanin/azurin family copper-binding protein [Actinomycetes bacterium]|nr:plastocyanin/azurin family copper-binding protein [Actinomycetes bacterium]
MPTRGPRPLALLGAAAAVTVLLAGCASGGGNGSSAAPAGSAPATTAPLAAGGGYGGRYGGGSGGGSGGSGGGTSTSGNAKIAGVAFPAKVQVTAGQKVTWTNTDGFPHTVTADNGSFDSGPVAAGTSYARTFKQAGTFAYHCKIHSSMHGTVVVTG